MQLEVYEDKSVTTKRLLNETEVEGGKTAVNGCPDFDAAAEVLKKAREKGVKGVREGGHIQGKYGAHSLCLYSFFGYFPCFFLATS